jgi:UDP-galactopyranose mutase
MLTDYSTIVVFSHLRWGFVYQRPQQLLSRMAARRRVIYIEEQIHKEHAEPYWSISKPEENVFVCQLTTPLLTGGFSDRQMPVFEPMLRSLLDELNVGNHIAWLYTPMALPLARTLEPDLLVYDCMDELSSFHDAPPELIERENELLKEANIVFTGGPSLYRNKRDRHPNVHCFPSSVDTAHFSKALDSVEPADQALIPHPRLGYYGVIDERIDYKILDALAKAHPEWQIVMVGPFAKVDPETAPRHPNIHYLGLRHYNELPAYLGGWDVCLMPFALNEATRFISPTKMLEYMAAEKPTVSTPITDVAEPYGHVVYLGDTPVSFTRACEQALSASCKEREARTADMRKALALTSWTATVQGMEELIAQTLRDRRGSGEIALAG